MATLGELMNGGQAAPAAPAEPIQMLDKKSGAVYTVPSIDYALLDEQKGTAVRASPENMAIAQQVNDAGKQQGHAFFESLGRGLWGRASDSLQTAAGGGTEQEIALRAQENSWTALAGQVISGGAATAGLTALAAAALPATAVGLVAAGAVGAGAYALSQVFGDEIGESAYENRAFSAETVGQRAMLEVPLAAVIGGAATGAGHLLSKVGSAGVALETKAAGQLAKATGVTKANIGKMYAEVAEVAPGSEASKLADYAKFVKKNNLATQAPEAALHTAEQLKDFHGSQVQAILGEAGKRGARPDFNALANQFKGLLPDESTNMFGSTSAAPLEKYMKAFIGRAGKASSDDLQWLQKVKSSVAAEAVSGGGTPELRSAVKFLQHSIDDAVGSLGDEGLTNQFFAAKRGFANASLAAKNLPRQVAGDIGGTTNMGSMVTQGGIATALAEALGSPAAAAGYLAAQAASKIAKSPVAQSRFLTGAAKAAAVLQAHEAAIQSISRGAANLLSGAVEARNDDFSTDKYDIWQKTLSDVQQAPSLVDESYGKHLADRYHDAPSDTAGSLMAVKRALGVAAQGLPPQPAVLQTSLDNKYDPPPSVKAEFMDRVRGILDIQGTLENPTKTSVAAMKAAWPETAQYVQKRVSDIVQNSQTLTYQQKLRLSLVYGVPISSLGSPLVTYQMQKHYAAAGAAAQGGQQGSARTAAATQAKASSFQKSVKSEELATDRMLER